MRQFTLGNSREHILEIIREHSIKKVSVGDQFVGLLRIGERFFAFETQCPHRGASLLKANVNALDELICPLHEYRFDLKTGQVKAGSCPDLQVYQCELLETGLQITMP